MTSFGRLAPIISAPRCSSAPAPSLLPSGSLTHTSSLRWLPRAALTATAAAAYAEHVRSMITFFDFGAHLRLNVALGALQLLLWTLWWLSTRRERPHAWRAPALTLLLAALLPLELVDRPPLWGVLDGHALWHAATVVPALLFWRAFVAVELRWERRHGV